MPNETKMLYLEDEYRKTFYYILLKLIKQILITLGCIFFIGLVGLMGLFAYKTNKATFQVETFGYQLSIHTTRLDSNLDYLHELDERLKKIEKK